jgi:ligand-binding sensor domain-containing protein
MNKVYLDALTCLLLFVLMFIFSCSEQRKTSLAESIQIESKIIKTKHAKVTKTQFTTNGLAENVHCGLQDKNGNLWFGPTGHGVFYYDGISFTNFTVIDGLNSNYVSSIIEDNVGNILIGTSQGVTRYNGKSFINFTRLQSFEKKAIISLLEDNKTRIWIGTMNDGTYVWDGKSFAHITSIDSIGNPSGLTLNMLMSITEDKAGNLWFASRAGEGVSSFDGHTITKYTSKQGITDSLFQSVMEDKSGILWFGSRDHGVFTYDGNLFTHRSDKHGPGNASITSLLEDRNGNIWFTTDKSGIYRYDGESFKNYTTQDGLNNNSVFSVVEDKAGNLWFGTRNLGLYRYDGETFVNFSE